MRAMTACLSPSTAVSSRTRSVVMMGGEVVELVMALLSSSACYWVAGIGEMGETCTAVRSIWAGVGSVVPGSAAAALP